MLVAQLMNSKIISQTTSLLYFAILFAFGWWASSYPQILIPGAIVLLVFIMLLIKFITGLDLRDLSFYKQLIAPVIFLVAAILFYIFFNTILLQKIFWVLVCLALYFYIYNLWLFYRHPASYQAFTLENFSWYLHLAGSWLFASSIYGLIIFINFKLYYALPLILAYSSLVFWQMWWIQKLEHKFKWWWYITFVVICFEAFVTFLVLPLSFYLLGFWWSVVWFLTATLIFQLVKESLVWKKYLLQSVLIFAIAILLTLTAKIF